jgi:hypothetical protein
MGSESETEPSEQSSAGVPERLQILATEHWSLLATRGMAWNEMFSRTGMFLTALSASMVAIALVADATDSRSTFRAFALLIIPVVLLLGVGTYIRLLEARIEDIWTVIGMNRLRRGYFEIAPDLERYFVTSGHDDSDGIIKTYHLGEAPTRRSPFIAATFAIVGVIDAVLIGVLAGLLVSLLTDEPGAYATVGAIFALVAGSAMAVTIPRRRIDHFNAAYTARFPSDSPP